MRNTFIKYNVRYVENSIKLIFDLKLLDLAIKPILTLLTRKYR